MDEEDAPGHVGEVSPVPGSSPEPASPGSQLKSPPPDWPSFAAEATDLQALRRAVEDAAAVGGGLWLSYLFVLFYLAVAAGAVTHQDLFFERPVKLPFLGIDLPLLAFFFLAPILFLITHVYTLVHFVMLTDKARRFHAELSGQIKGCPECSETDAAGVRNALRHQLPSNIFVQFLAGPEDMRGSLLGALLQCIAWTTLVVGPILLLLLLQLQFLPYHSSAITWVQRVVLLVDLVALWWLWRIILSGRGLARRWHQRTTWIVLSVGCIAFSWCVATFPGEWQDRDLPSLRVFGIKGRHDTTRAVSLHDLFFDLPVDPLTRRRRSYLSNTLVLTGLNLYEALGIDDPGKVAWRQTLFIARSRDLNGAVFDLAILPKVDFTGAQLRHASLHGANLEGTTLIEAQLQNASLHEAKLKGASLERVQLQDAFVDQAQLPGVSLRGARLDGASLELAQLQGALLNGAHMKGASLFGAQLQGAYLSEAELQGAWLLGAQLQGATLPFTHMEGAVLYFAQLQGTSLFGAHLEGASLSWAHLEGASLIGTQLQGASLQEAQLQGASLYAAQLQGASLDRVRLQGASLYRAELKGASLPGAGLQGAALVETRLQGAVLDRADLTASDLRGASLWRSSAIDPKLEKVWLSAKTQWTPSLHPPWSEQSYQELKSKLVSAIPPGRMRDDALKRIARLDCAGKDETLASCDPAGASPAAATAWRDALERARTASDGEYETALAYSLQDLVCGEGGSVEILRGLVENGRIKATGHEAAALVDHIMGAACPVANALTSDDKADLSGIKAAASPSR